MQFPGQGKPPVGIFFDCDMAGIDDPLALALLYGLDGKGEARVVSVSVSRPSLKAAAYCDAVGRFYAGAVSGAFGAYGRTLPIGMRSGRETGADPPMLAAPLERRTPEGAPAYAHGIRNVNDTADPATLIRNGLTAQHDGNAIVILAGPATNLAALLEVSGAKDWIARKVRVLVLAGAYPDRAAEPTVGSDVAAARKLFAEWPTPVVACGQEVAEAIEFPAASIDKDFAWTAHHPVADACRANRGLAGDAPAGAMAAVLHAVRPQEGYFKLSEPGTIRVLDDGRTKFMPSPDGKHRYLVLDAAQKERILEAFTELASAKPVPRQPRFRPPQQQQPPKPPDKKPPASA